MDKKASQIAREAASVLKNQRWAQKFLKISDTGACLSAAEVEESVFADRLRYDELTYDVFGIERNELLEKLRSIDVGPKGSWPSLVSFNDAQAKDKESVIEQLMMRADELEKEGL